MVTTRAVNLTIFIHLLLALFATSGALTFVFQSRYMGLLCPLVILLVPVVALCLWLFKKARNIHYSEKIKRTVLAFRLLTFCGWCLSLLPGLFWGSIFFHLLEPWPFSRQQGPDTASARAGFKTVVGFEPNPNIGQIFYKGYEIRDYSRFLRFRTCNSDVEDQVVADLEPQAGGQSIPTFHLNSRLSWWLVIPEAAQFEHWKGDYKAVWLDRQTCTFYVRSWTT